MVVGGRWSVAGRRRVSPSRSPPLPGGGVGARGSRGAGGPSAAAFSPPPFQGGGREGGPALARSRWAGGGSSPRPPFQGGEGGRSTPPARRQLCRRGTRRPDFLAPPPFQGGGREGGPALARSRWAGGGSSPRPPFQGGGEKVAAARLPGGGGGVDSGRWPVAGGRRVAPSRSPLFQGEESGPGGVWAREGSRPPFSLLPPSRGEVGRGVPRWRAVGGRAAGHPPRPPFQGGEKVGGARPRPGDSYVGEVPDALTFWLLPPFRGEVGRGEESGQGDRIWKFCDGSEASVSPGGERGWPPFSLLPPSGGRSGGGSRRWVRRRARAIHG